MDVKKFTREDLQRVYRPPKDSHKGQNGRVLVIGGSELFHASIFWTADVVSRMVDLVHFCSPAAENNELVRKRGKQRFWDGIVVDWGQIEGYIAEDDVVVIGPGMPRDDGLGAGEKPTGEIVDELLSKYPQKKWVVDGGALQEGSLELFTESMVITPHLGEFKRLLEKLGNSNLKSNNDKLSVKLFEELVEKRDLDGVLEMVCSFGEVFGGTVLLKGFDSKDVVCGNDQAYVIEGGNEGLTKGGTGDVLAGLVAGFYAKNEAVLSAAAGSLVLKQTAEELGVTMGPYFKTSELVEEVPVVLNELLNQD